MKALFPYPYDAWILAGKWQHARHVSLVDTVEVDVPEIAEDDAPVALEWNVYVAERVGQTDRAVDVPVRNEVRFHDGAFYRPFSVKRDEPETARHAYSPSALPDGGGPCPEFGPRYVDLFPGEAEGSRFGMVRRRLRDGSVKTDIDGLAVKHIERSTREEWRARAEAVASTFLIVGDAVFVRCEEPTLFLAVRHVGYEPGLQAGVCLGPVGYDDRPVLNYGESLDPATTMYFRADGFDDMVGMMEASEIAPWNMRFGDVSVLMPEVFRFDVAGNVLERLCEFVLRTFRERVGGEGRAFANTYYDIREAMEAYAVDRDMAALERGTLCALQSLAERFPDAAGQAIRVGLERWESGGIDASIMALRSPDDMAAFSGSQRRGAP